ncbi:unnamed protein product [Alopecurus aequalis]
MRRRIIVWDPVAEDRRAVAYPLRFHDSVMEIHRGAVLCAAGDQGHVHGACHSNPFKVVWLGSYVHDDEPVAFASVYSSETDLWGDLISATLPHRGVYFSGHSKLVGNTLHWLLNSYGMLEFDLDVLEFDLDAQRLVVTKRPPVGPRADNARIIQAEDGGVGFAALSGPIYHPCLQMWNKKVNSHGVATWLLWKTVELQKILGLKYRIEKHKSFILHYLEDVHAIFFRVRLSVYMVQLDSMRSKELFQYTHNCIYRPFTSFYTEGVLSSLKQKQPITG